MENYYTEKEKYIHEFLLTKGWADEEINKAMFHIIKWTTVMGMPIESYYTLIMEEGNYAKYKEHIDYGDSNGVTTEGYLYFKKRYRMAKFIITFILSFIAAVFVILIIRP